MEQGNRHAAVDVPEAMELVEPTSLVVHYDGPLGHLGKHMAQQSARKAAHKNHAQVMMHQPETFSDSYKMCQIMTTSQPSRFFPISVAIDVSVKVTVGGPVFCAVVGPCLL